MYGRSGSPNRNTSPGPCAVELAIGETVHRELADPHRVLRALGETTTAVKVRVVYAVNGYGPNVPQATKAASARSTTLTAIFIASCRRA